MDQKRPVRRLIVCGMLSAAVAVAGCTRAEDDAPPPEVQSEALQPTDRPVTVSGCLQAGDAENTFVLTAARADGVGETATYHLIGATDRNLGDHIGQRVRVSGTLQVRQTAAAQTMAVPADRPADSKEDEERPAATTGTPTVQTRTDVMINELAVDSMTPLVEECGMGQ